MPYQGAIRSAYLPGRHNVYDSTDDVRVFLRNHFTESQNRRLLSAHRLLADDLMDVVCHNLDSYRLGGRLFGQRLSQVEQTVEASILRLYQCLICGLIRALQILRGRDSPLVNNDAGKLVISYQPPDQRLIIFLIPRTDFIVIGAESRKPGAG